MTDPLIITDSPESMAGLGGLIPKTPWNPIALSDWGDDTKRAWQAVGGAADAAPVTASGLVPWRQIMAVGRSPFSQVDGLRDLEALIRDVSPYRMEKQRIENLHSCYAAP